MCVYCAKCVCLVVCMCEKKREREERVNEINLQHNQNHDDPNKNMITTNLY